MVTESRDQVAEFLRKLVPETVEWREKNFPAHSAVHQMLGVIEEQGELCHHWLKEQQGIRGSADEHQAEQMDAIGDLTIFLTGYCHYRGVDLVESYNRVQASPDGKIHGPDAVAFYLASAVGRLARAEGHIVTSQFQARHSHSHPVGWIVFWLKMFCLARGWNYVQLVTLTWDQVKKRDWQADPLRGGEPPAALTSPGD